MEQTTPKYQDHEGDSSKVIPDGSSSAGSNNLNNPSTDVQTNGVEETNESPPQHRDTGTSSAFAGTGSDNGSEAEDRKRPEKALKEIKTQDTHALYCPNCKTNITKTAVLFENGNEPPPYKQSPFVLWVPLVIPKFPCFRRSPPEPVVTPPNPPEPVVIDRPDAIPDPNPPGPDVIIQPNHQEPVPWPQWLQWPHWPSLRSSRFLLVVALLLLSVILLWVTPTHVLENDTPSPPSPPPADYKNEHFPPFPPEPVQNSTRIYIGGGGLISFSWSWVTSFPNVRFLSVLPLLFLAIVALRLPSIPCPITGGSFSLRLPSIPFPITDPTLLPGILWEHIVVPVQNLLPTELDILKSIVYGGLIDSITSLGVVSSAAASGASTLNVLALGLANLFSGLFLIIHNLYGLLMSEPPFQGAKNDHMANVGAEDPYQNLLGNRRKFKRHCFVVVVSFIIFGVIPPLFYGLSFKRTEKGHYKAAVVLAVSLVCVISLSFAKAYAFGMQKLKTVVEYTGMAIGASALSFIVSQMVSDTLEKYGFHELASDYRKG